MSKDIIVMIKRTAMPKGEVKFNSDFCATANPVIVGFSTRKFRIRIAETMFAINKEVFIIYPLT